MGNQANSNSMSKSNAGKSYQGYQAGDYTSRKGRLCRIKRIHFETNPPAVTVLMMDTNTEVGTEFDRLKPVHSWFCSICTAHNEDINASKYSFCGWNRNYKEQIAIYETEDEESTESDSS